MSEFRPPKKPGEYKHSGKGRSEVQNAKVHPCLEVLYRTYVLQVWSSYSYPLFYCFEVLLCRSYILLSRSPIQCPILLGSRVQYPCPAMLSSTVWKSFTNHICYYLEILFRSYVLLFGNPIQILYPTDRKSYTYPMRVLMSGKPIQVIYPTVWKFKSDPISQRLGVLYKSIILLSGSSTEVPRIQFLCLIV